MKIDPETLNSKIEYCIDEYVRLIEHRDILREHWFEGKSINGLATDHKMSETSIKKVLYDIGDSILIRALKMSKKKSD